MNHNFETTQSDTESISNVIYRKALLPKKAPRNIPGRILCEGIKLVNAGEVFDANSIFQGIKAWKYKEFIVSTEEGGIFYGRPGIPGGGPTSNGVVVDVGKVLHSKEVSVSSFQDTELSIGTLVVGEEFLGQTVASISSCDQRDFRIVDADNELALAYDSSFDDLDAMIDETLPKHSSAWQLATEHMFKRG